ncbi:MAG: SIS domain-containing protein [Candidatus Falkowbacteria bacterium]
MKLPEGLSQQDFDSTVASLSALPDQITDILTVGQQLTLPDNYRDFNKVVVSGMGGSNLGARIIASVFADELKMPIIISADYQIPAFVDANTLFILSSYSGGTEETLASYQEAKRQGAKCLVITAESADNQLVSLAKTDNLPILAFQATHNPSGQPRLAVGYTCFALSAVLDKLGIINLNQLSIKNTLQKMKGWGDAMLPDKEDNDAAKIAGGLKGRQIVLIAGDFLAGNLHTLRNQLNENSKNFASYLVLPDLNHHAMEGLAKPDSNKDDIIFVFFDSSLYSEKVQQRAKLTKQVVAKNGIAFADIQLLAHTKLGQSLEMLQLGAWVTLYLALENGVNPLTIPWVDWFKAELKK